MGKAELRSEKYDTMSKFLLSRKPNWELLEGPTDSTADPVLLVPFLPAPVPDHLGKLGFRVPCPLGCPLLAHGGNF